MVPWSGGGKSSGCGAPRRGREVRSGGGPGGARGGPEAGEHAVGTGQPRRQRMHQRRLLLLLCWGRGGVRGRETVGRVHLLLCLHAACQQV